MSDLSARVKQALAFNKNYIVSQCIEANQDDQAGLQIAICDWVASAATECARTKPVTDALVECALALEKLVNPIVMQRSDALDNLESALAKAIK